MEKINFNSKVEQSLIVAEYESLREEIQARLYRIFKLHQGLLLGTLIYATTFYVPNLLSAMEKERSYLTTVATLYYLFILILPFIAFVVEIICTSEQDAIFRAGIYIKEHIEKVYRKSTFRGWEDWLTRQDKVKRRRTSDNLIIKVRRILIIPLYCISSSIVCTIGFSLLLNFSANLSFILLIIILSLYLSLYIFMIKKLNKAQKDEFSSPLYNLLVLDVDGCLLDDKKEISEVNKEAITFIRKKGVQIILATGRSSLSLKHICKELNLKGHHITCHGSSIYDVSNDQENQLLNVCLSGDELKNIIEEVNKLHILWVAFGINEIYCMKENAESVISRLKERSDIEEEDKQFICTIEKPLTFNWTKKIICKILCYINFEERDDIKELERSLSQQFQVVMSTENTLEIIHKNAKKEVAVQEILRKNNSNDEMRSLVVGDYDNDVGLLSWGRQAVAPSNSSIKVKNIEGVDVLESSNNEDLIQEVARAYFGLNPFRISKKYCRFANNKI